MRGFVLKLGITFNVLLRIQVILDEILFALWKTMNIVFNICTKK
jgi:hypothetical protein